MQNWRVNLNFMRFPQLIAVIKDVLSERHKWKFNLIFSWKEKHNDWWNVKIIYLLKWITNGLTNHSSTVRLFLLLFDRLVKTLLKLIEKCDEILRKESHKIIFNCISLFLTETLVVINRLDWFRCNKWLIKRLIVTINAVLYSKTRKQRLSRELAQHLYYCLI